MKETTSAQIVASGGAGKFEHFYQAVEAGATILLVASVFLLSIDWHPGTEGVSPRSPRKSTLTGTALVRLGLNVPETRDFRQTTGL